MDLLKNALKYIIEPLKNIYTDLNSDKVILNILRRFCVDGDGWNILGSVTKNPCDALCIVVF